MRLSDPEDNLQPGGSRPLVSVVIRARDEEARIGECLEALRTQDLDGVGEVLVVDSGSTDRTVEIARSFGVGVLEIPPASFTYSSALNSGIERTNASLVVLLSAHVVPQGRCWLEQLTRHFDDSSVAGVHSRELPWDDADQYERQRLAGLFPPIGMTRSLDLATDDERDDESLLVFSNAAACIRRSLWMRHPFAELPYCEDMEWARWALGQGYRTVYEPRARVRHSHNESLGVRVDREVKSYLAYCRIFDRDLRRLRAGLGRVTPNVLLALGALTSPLPLTRKLYWSGYAAVKWMRFAWRMLWVPRPDPAGGPPERDNRDAARDADAARHEELEEQITRPPTSPRVPDSVL